MREAKITTYEAVAAALWKNVSTPESAVSDGKGGKLTPLHLKASK